ncbi:MAG: FlgD immunoglobulin-like domain containing protein [bacterium]
MKKAMFIAVCLLFAASIAFAERLLVLEESGFTSLKNAVEAIRASGGRVRIAIYPRFIIADLPDASEHFVRSHIKFSGVYGDEVDPVEFARYDDVGKHIAAAWNNVFMKKSAQAGLDAEPSPDRKPLIDDAFYADDELLLMRPPGAKIYDTSDYMLGSIVIGVLLPESNGSIDPSTEDWTETQMDNVTSEVISGLDWYVAKADFRPVTFYTVFHYQVPTGYEPINHPSSYESQWRDQCLSNLGYTGRYNYVNAMRDSLNTDWAVLALVVNDYNDPDNAFTDGMFAYSYLGGPNLVMTYDNDGWGIANMDAVIAHELGHSFFALDEYYEAGHPCTDRSGYLNVENQNSEYPYGAGGCALNIRFCIMRSVSLGNARVCDYTKGHIGWWDTDGDSICDIIDTFPETVLYPYSPDPCSTFTPTYAGSCWVNPLPNLNPRDNWPDDVTINRIAKVEYRVDFGDWYEAIPNDGGWDGGKEGFHFTPNPLESGTHIFEARAFHTYGNYDTSYAVDTLTIVSGAGIPVVGGKAGVIIASPARSRVDISYEIPGSEGSLVAASMKIYDVRGKEVRTLFDGLKNPGSNRVTWDGRYGNGDLAPSGIYFLDFTAGENRVIRKIVIVR